MIKMPMLKKQLEEYFKENRIKYLYLNSEHKNISIPMYMLNLRVVDEKTNKIEKDIPVMISIFKSAEVIFLESFNIYKVNKRNYAQALKIINSMNRYSFPGKFFIDDDNYISYRCIMSYSNTDNLDFVILKQMLDSIPPAYYILLEQIVKCE